MPTPTDPYKGHTDGPQLTGQAVVPAIGPGPGPRRDSSRSCSNSFHAITRGWFLERSEDESKEKSIVIVIGGIGDKSRAGATTVLEVSNSSESKSKPDSNSNIDG